MVASSGFGILVITLLFTVGSLFRDAGERPAFVGQSDGPVLVGVTLVYDAEKKAAGYLVFEGFVFCSTFFKVLRLDLFCVLS